MNQRCVKKDQRLDFVVVCSVTYLDERCTDDGAGVHHGVVWFVCGTVSDRVREVTSLTEVT